MKLFVIVICLLVLSVKVFEAKDFVDGTRINNLLISTDKVEVGKIFLFKREKDYTYVDSKQRVIKSILARDLARTDAEVTVTAGGVGSTHVTLHFTSGRGQQLNYLILIFSENSQ